MAGLTITVTLEDDVNYITSLYQQESSAYSEEATGLQNLFAALGSGAKVGKVDVTAYSATPTAAARAVTLDNAALSAADTITIGGVVVTARASGATGNEFNIGGSSSASATNFAALVNSSSSFQYLVSASAASAVVTLTSLVKGSIGNLITLATSDASAFAFSGSALTGGAGGLDTVVSYGYGLA